MLSCLGFYSEKVCPQWSKSHLRIMCLMACGWPTKPHIGSSNALYNVSARSLGMAQCANPKEFPTHCAPSTIWSYDERMLEAQFASNFCSSLTMITWSTQVDLSRILFTFNTAPTLDKYWVHDDDAWPPWRWTAMSSIQCHPIYVGNFFPLPFFSYMQRGSQ